MPDAPGADLLVVVGVDEHGAPVAVAVEAARRRSVEAVARYDATRALGHVTLDGADGPAPATSADEQLARRLVPRAGAARRRVASAAVETALEMAVEYAKERFTFGRAIGSYQAVKHGAHRGPAPPGERALAAVLRGLGLRGPSPSEFALAASARALGRGLARSTSPRAQNIATHGGIGATWEHDAPLFFRRAQLSRRLLGGTGDATDRVAAELLAAA